MRPPVVLVHGMWSQPWVWDGWRARFEDAGYRCTAVTLPGHHSGASDGAVAGLALGACARAVEAEVRRLDRPVIIGHSMGGLLAQQVASRVPVAALILVCSAAPSPIFPLRPIMLPGLARHFARPDLWRRAFRLSRFEARHLLFNRIPAAGRDALQNRLTAESGRIVYELGFGPLNLAGTNRVAAHAISCPIRAFAGVHDHIIPVAVSRRLADLYAGRIVYTEHADHGHWMLGEAGADDRADEILGWMTQVEP